MFSPAKFTVGLSQAPDAAQSARHQFAERLFRHACPLRRFFHCEETVMHESQQRLCLTLYRPFGTPFSTPFSTPLGSSLGSAFSASFLTAFFFTAAQFHEKRHILHLHFFVFFRCFYSICNALRKFPLRGERVETASSVEWVERADEDDVRPAQLRVESLYMGDAGKRRQHDN